LIDNLIAADGRPTLCNSAVEMIEFGAIYFTSVLCTWIVSESEQSTKLRVMSIKQYAACTSFIPTYEYWRGQSDFWND